MYSLLSRSRLQPRNRTVHITQQATEKSRLAPQLFHRQRKASYYFDASRHTALSFRLLLAQLKEQKVSSQQRYTREFLCLSMDNLLASIRPGIDDDEQSQQYFTSLLRMHFAHLTSDEITQLFDTLKTAQFSCNIVETIIDDEVYRNYGFANGPPHSFNRTLMQTQDFFNLLEDLKDSVRQSQRMPLHGELSAGVRHALHASISVWMQSDKTLDDLHHSVCLIAKALNLPMAPTEVIVGSVATKSTTVIATQNAITVDVGVAEAVVSDTKGSVFSEWLRDVLELLLTQKLFGIVAPPDKLTRVQQQQLSAAIEQIYTCMPASSAPDLKLKARAVLKEAQHFGEIQIQPTTGVALGHAWISPSLSMVPDKRKNSVDIGHRYMHSGFHLEPGDSQIREWPAYFMTTKESEETYPSQHAWSLRVPVDAKRLQVAAREVRHEWESRDLPYRFIGTTPGMPATGCRTTVWEAVQRGMTDDAQTLFQHYNRGLPEPQSPTELWQRLDGLMRWIEVLATD
jgi:hypothetical protein